MAGDMTSLLPPSARTAPRPAGDVRADLATRRPLVPMAAAGGALAAGGVLLVCLAAGVVGWFATDGGAHGAPRDALRTGALAWLMGHGSGVHVEGAAITVMPLGLTLLSALTLWRVGLRVGVSVSGHGPDAEELGDGQRDVVVPLAGALFTAGYLLTTVSTATLAATPSTDPDTARVVLWSLVLCVGVGVPAIAVGSGRAAVWVALVPHATRAALRVGRRIVLLWLAISFVLLLVALGRNLDTAANVVSQLHAGGGGLLLIVVVSLLVLPNAVVFSGSYLLGPGFAVGNGTLVSPGAVALGPLPAFPMLAALPADGTTPAWAPWLVLLAPLTAAAAAAWSQHTWPTLRWEEGAVHGLGGGLVAGVGFAVLAGLSGGAVGPGRMADVAPFAFDAGLHAVTAFGLGGLLGGLAMTWWQRRTYVVDVELDD